MMKTVWRIIDKTETKTIKSEFTYYHFGKMPKFPAWYMEKNHIYTIEIILNIKLEVSPKTFFRCLTHWYLVK